MRDEVHLLIVSVLHEGVESGCAAVQVEGRHQLSDLVVLGKRGGVPEGDVVVWHHDGVRRDDALLKGPHGADEEDAVYSELIERPHDATRIHEVGRHVAVKV